MTYLGRNNYEDVHMLNWLNLKIYTLTITLIDGILFFHNPNAMNILVQIVINRNIPQSQQP